MLCYVQFKLSEDGRLKKNGQIFSKTSIFPFLYINCYVIALLNGPDIFSLPEIQLQLQLMNNGFPLILFFCKNSWFYCAKMSNVGPRLTLLMLCGSIEMSLIGFFLFIFFLEILQFIWFRVLPFVRFIDSHLSIDVTQRNKSLWPLSPPMGG